MTQNIYAVHCWIKGGGALNVLEALLLKKIKSGQHIKYIYTLYSDRKRVQVNNDSLDPLLIPIITALPSWLNTFFARVDRRKPRGFVYFFDYRNLFVFYPWLMNILSWKLQRQLKKESGDILISSYAVAKNIDVPSGVVKEIYFHQPMHYIWTLYDEYISYMQGWKRWLYKQVTPRLRRWDARVRHYDLIYANSQSTQQQIAKLYFPGDTPSIQVVHPPIEQSFFNEQVILQPDNYFFYINRLTKMFKHLDKIILLCNKHKIPLIIAGDGPDKYELMQLAGDTITFVGRVSDITTKKKLLGRSRGVFGIAHESFGIVTAEALLLGIPIFGLDAGATPELVDEHSGVLTPSLDETILDQKFQEFLTKDFDREAIQTRARAILGPGQKFWD